MKKIKALCLFSGGLDSVLVIKILQKQKINVTALIFKSCFFKEEKAVAVVKKLKIKYLVKNISDEHLKMIKNPKYGYGSAMNPCIDCHLMMIKKAGEFINLLLISPLKMGRDFDFDFIATGEVLGQRPMSQNKQSLKLIEKKSKIKGYLLRPLCAKLLEPTILEEQGLIKREKLLDISGRSRKRQIELAKKYKIKNYETPAGGCLLTDSEFGKRLKKLFEINLDCDKNDIELLKIGRHFWKKSQIKTLTYNADQNDEKQSQGVCKIVVGRDKNENEKLEKLAQKKDVLIKMKNYSGPTTLIRSYTNKISKIILEKAKELTQYYSTKARDKNDVEFLNNNNNNNNNFNK